MIEKTYFLYKKDKKEKLVFKIEKKYFSLVKIKK